MSNVSSQLSDQIAQQTKNMFHFAKSAQVCISAMRTCAKISREAADKFEAECQNMEEGCEEMIQAFGIGQHAASFSSGSASQLEHAGLRFHLTVVPKWIVKDILFLVSIKHCSRSPSRLLVATLSRRPTTWPAL